MSDGCQAWITGIGLVSSIGEGLDCHCPGPGTITADPPTLETAAFAPYPVHPLVAVDFGRQIAAKAEQRQMGRWQRIGVYAAGLALADAGLKERPDLLDRTDLIVAAGNGERDEALDSRVLADWPATGAPGPALNAALATGLRPTLYLGELSNLLAGNIQIVHKVTGSSRTFKGEEMAGVAAVENAVRRIGAGQGELFLVGGALNGEREDLLLGYELGQNLWAHPFAPVWQRKAAGGGFVPGSAGAFLVIEAASHARARGARAYARIPAVVSDRSRRTPGAVKETLGRLMGRLAGHLDGGALAVLSGASGVEPATAEELAFLEGLAGGGRPAAIRAYGSRLGHTVEAHFPLGVALAALAAQKASFYPPFDGSGVEASLTEPLRQVLVTAVGHWRGEGLALVEKIAAEETRP